MPRKAMIDASAPGCTFDKALLVELEGGSIQLGGKHLNCTNSRITDWHSVPLYVRWAIRFWLRKDR